MKLRDICHARSGDKGDTSNVGLVVYDRAHYDWLVETITVEVVRAKAGIAVSVNDTGPGIPANQRERIFERFAQEKSGRERAGFGLGLAFCRSAIAAHGGRIWAEGGNHGVGTKILFTLPAEHGGT